MGLFSRTGEIEEEAIAHEGNKASRAIFLKNGLVFTTGFTKHSERQYSLRAPGHLDDPIVMVELDTSNGVMFPLYDPDANLIYLCGKVSHNNFLLKFFVKFFCSTYDLKLWNFHIYKIVDHHKISFAAVDWVPKLSLNITGFLFKSLKNVLEFS